MKKWIALLSVLSFTVLAQGSKEDLENQLHAFLTGASVNDALIHNQFWASDLVYTSSSGTRFGKDVLMQGVNGEGKVDNPAVLYSADDVHIRLLDNIALLDFTLVATDSANANQKSYYLNSGVFVWRDERWQAVNWQATKKALPTKD